MIAKLITILLLLFLAEESRAQVMNDVSSIRRAIARVNEVVPDAENDTAQMLNNQHYQALRQSAPAIWQTALDNLDSVAPTRGEQTILLQSFEGLSKGSYLQFLNRALDLFSQGDISLGVFTYSVMFPSGKMQFFISHNYDQPEVAAFLEKAEEALKKNGEPLMFNVQEARSGKLKKLHDAARANHPELAKQPIPLLRPTALPSPTAVDPPQMAMPDNPSKSEASPSPVVQVEHPKSTPLPWIFGAILLLVVSGGIFFKFLRK